MPGLVITAAPAFVPFAPPSIGPEEIREVTETLESGWLSTGPRVHRFEEAFAQYTGAAHAVAVNSCTAALHLSLVASGIGAGDEVITTPLTFCATANVIVHAGATPVFADIDPRTGNIDPSAVAEALTPRTRAIIPVHYGGRPVDIEAITGIAAPHGLVVIEDAAHCIEGVRSGRKIGATSPFTCFSFYASKNLTTGEGGMVTTDSAEAAATMRMLSLHGLSQDAWTRYERGGSAQYDVVMPGFKYNMTDLQAAIGIHQLAAINRHFARRVEVWARYDEGFADLPIARFDNVPQDDVHAHHLYTVLIDPQIMGRTRDEVAKSLADQEVASSQHFRALHLHSYYRDRFGFTRGMFPHAERISDTVLSLPFSASITDSQVDRVIEAFRRAVGADR
jgi:dTDP-4-amino-4,6-dideoxygalactose transaminase